MRGIKKCPGKGQLKKIYRNPDRHNLSGAGGRKFTWLDSVKDAFNFFHCVRVNHLESD